MNVRRRAVVLAGLSAGTLALAGCVVPLEPPSPSASVFETSAPPGGSSGLEADVAFVVSGKLAAPEGEVEIGFRVTVGAPTTASAAQDEAVFATSTHCPPEALAEFAPLIAQPSYVHVRVETTVVSGTVLPGDYGLPGAVEGPGAWSGDYAGFQASCATPALPTFPGVAEGVIIVESGQEVGGGSAALEFTWLPRGDGYGLTIERALADGAVAHYRALTCGIEFGPASGGTAALDLVRVLPDSGCLFGIAG